MDQGPSPSSPASAAAALHVADSAGAAPTPDGRAPSATTALRGLRWLLVALPLPWLVRDFMALAVVGVRSDLEAGEVSGLFLASRLLQFVSDVAVVAGVFWLGRHPALASRATPLLRLAVVHLVFGAVVLTITLGGGPPSSVLVAAAVVINAQRTLHVHNALHAVLIHHGGAAVGRPTVGRLTVVRAAQTALLACFSFALLGIVVAASAGHTGVGGAVVGAVYGVQRPLSLLAAALLLVLLQKTRHAVDDAILAAPRAGRG
jgi:hypothetical protein